MTAQYTVDRSAASPALPAAHAERLQLAARPENEGETFQRADYVTLVLATVVVPLLLMLLAWFS